MKTIKDIMEMLDFFYANKRHKERIVGKMNVSEMPTNSEKPNN